MNSVADQLHRYDFTTNSATERGPRLPSNMFIIAEYTNKILERAHAFTF